MNVCLCGNLVNEAGELCPRCAALRTLELGADATEDQIRTAYRTQSQIWRPDRFEDDAALKQSADAKLKAIHSAFDYLTSPSMIASPRWKPPSVSIAGEGPEGLARKARAAMQPSTSSAAPAVIADAAPAPPLGVWQRIKSVYRIWRRIRLVLGLAALAFALLTGRSIRTYLTTHSSSFAQTPSAGGTGQQSIPNRAAEPTAVTPDAAKQGAKSPRQPKAAPAAEPQAARPATKNADIPMVVTSRNAVHQTLQTSRVVKAYLTVGSTKEEVIGMLGTPTSSSDEKLVYGKSELFLKNGAVVGWRIDPFANPIRVKLWPEAAVDTSLEYFTLGSSKDDVLAVQGTPTAFSEDEFDYGGSKVFFRNDRVVNWKSDANSIPLRTRLQ